MTAIIGALEPTLNAVIPSGPPNAHSNFTCLSHACGMWDHADPTEYVDASDYHALIAPRPLLLLTGSRDEIYLTGVDGSIDPMPTHFSPDKEAARLHASVSEYTARPLRRAGGFGYTGSRSFIYTEESLLW